MNIPDSVNPQDPRAPWAGTKIEFETTIIFDLGPYQCETTFSDTTVVPNYNNLDKSDIIECCTAQAEESFQLYLDSKDLNEAVISHAIILSWEEM